MAYEKQTWSSNELITADKLNHIEDGIAEAKTTQTAVNDPTASGTTIAFIDSISQNTQGVIIPTKKTIPNASQSTAGLMSATDKTKLDEIATGAAVTSVNNETGAVSITPANIGAVTKSGDTMTGNLTISPSSGPAALFVQASNGLIMRAMVEQGGYHGLYSNGYWDGSDFISDLKWMIFREREGKVGVADHYNKNEVDSIVAQVNYKKHDTVQSGADLTISQLPQACLISTYGTMSGSLAMFSVVGYGATNARNKVTQIIGSSEITVTPLDNAFGVVLHNSTAVAITVSVMDLS